MTSFTNQEQDTLYSLRFNEEYDGEFVYQDDFLSLRVQKLYEGKYYICCDDWLQECDSFDELIEVIGETKNQL